VDLAGFFCSHLPMPPHRGDMNVVEALRNTTNSDPAGPVPLGEHFFEAPARSWPWLAAIRSQKIIPHLTYAESVMDYSRDAGWNIATVNCKRKFACSPAGTITHPFKEIESVPNLAGKEHWDLIVTHHTLGSLIDPHQTLTDLLPGLGKTGRLLVFLPLETERSVRALANEESSPWLYTWNVQTFANLLSEAGYDLLDARVLRFGSETFALRLLQRFGGGERAFYFWRAFSRLFQPSWEIRALSRPFVD
jgi:hypothetical protein